MNARSRHNSVLNIMTAHYRGIIFSFCILLGLFIIFGSAGKKQQAEAATSNLKYYKCITISDGDTFWSIAEENYSEEYESYEDYIDEVKFINNLTNDTIYNGATLVVPYYQSPS